MTNRILLNEPAYGAPSGTLYGESLEESVGATDAVATRVNGIDDLTSTFSQESVYSVGWYTKTDYPWPAAGTVIPFYPEYVDNVVDPGPHLIDYGTDWLNSGNWYLTSNAASGDSTVQCSGASNTTLTADANIGDMTITVASGSSYQSFFRLKVGSDPTIYTVASGGGTATTVYLARPITQFSASGAAVTYQPFCEVGDQVRIVNGDSYPYNVNKTVQSRTNTSITFTTTLGMAFTSAPNNHIGLNAWWKTVSFVTDSDFDHPVLHQDIVQGFPGGFMPGNIQRHPGYSGNLLAFEDSEFESGQQEMYVGMEIKTMSGFSMPYQMGLKIWYVGGDGNSVAHILPIYVTDTIGGSQMWPAMGPQNPTDIYNVTHNSQNNLNDGLKHKLEWWIKANTAGNTDGQLKLWIDGRLEINMSTGCKWFNNGDPRHMNQFKCEAIYGGGYNFSIQDQWIRYGRLLIRVR